MKNQHAQKLFIVFTLVFISIVLTADVYSQNMFRKINDFDGDGRADHVITRNENGLKVWYVWQSTAGFRVFQWGLDSDTEAAGDYDNDGKTDFAVSRLISSNGYAYYVYQSAANTVYIKSFGTAQPITFIEPIQQDYDGDGKTDLSYFFKWNNTDDKTIFVFESGSSNPNHFTNFTINNNYSILRLGDLTGDGESEIVTLNPADHNLTILDYNTRSSQTIQFGTSGDQYVAGDFDGDGTGDLAVFRESDGTWWWIGSSDGGVRVAVWGISGDTPVPADYDGDGITDLAIWRDGFYWILGSQDGVSVFNWGISTDAPVNY